MQALILDNSIMDLATIPFPVAEPLYWTECPEETTREWTFDGTVFSAPQLPQPSIEELTEAVRLALQGAIDIKAKSFGFSEGNALMLYAGFTNPFQPLAQVFASWEASVWVQADAYKAEVLAGTKPMLTPEEAVALMPAYPS